jgi:predicted peroxiredoxin
MSDQRERSMLLNAIGLEDQAIALAEKIVGAEEAKAYAQLMLARMEKFRRLDTEILGQMYGAQLASKMEAKVAS